MRAPAYPSAGKQQRNPLQHRGGLGKGSYTDQGELRRWRRCHVNIPLALARVAMRFVPKEARAELADKDINLDEVIEAIMSGRRQHC